MLGKLLAGCALALVPAIAFATETITYNYDAKGRLVRVAKSGSVNNGVTVTYNHDRADNRTSVTVAGSP